MSFLPEQITLSAAVKVGVADVRDWAIAVLADTVALLKALDRGT
jgi:hypothetical protein